MGYRISIEDKKKMVELYNGGLSAKEAASSLGYSENTCLRALKKFGIDRRELIPESIRKAMVMDYQKGLTAEQAARKYGYSAKVCFTSLRKAGVLSRSTSEYLRVYSLDESFFDFIDTEEKAYVLGFIAGDGCIQVGGKSNESNYRLRINLKRTDKKHLFKIKNAIKSEHPVFDTQCKLSNGKLYYGSSVVFTSVRLVKSLIDKGITPRKSFTVKPYKFIDTSLESSYWRGIVDADGSIGTANLCWYISLSGNKYMVKGFSDFINKNVITKAKSRSSDGRKYEIKYSGNNLVYSIAKLLYKDANIYLDRKYELAQELMAAAENKNTGGTE